MPSLVVFNGSSVSGEVTNNIDLPVNGIISQSVHWHVYYEARARFRVDGTNASTPRERETIPPQTCPFTPVLHFHHFLHALVYIFARLVASQNLDNDPARKGQCSAVEVCTLRGKTFV